MSRLPVAFAALACCANLAAAVAQSSLIAHRGESHDAPENTMPAFRLAADRGFGFECDLYLSADGKVFTFHDPDLRRTTGGKMDKPCVRADWRTEISGLNVAGWGKWKGSKYDPSRPALLEEVCALARNGRWIYCDVKGEDPAIVPAIAAVLASQRTATPENLLFIAFSRKLCAEFKRLLPRYKVYWLTSGRNASGGKIPADKIIATLKRLGADGVDVKYRSEYHDEAFVREIKSAGYSFHVWTVDRAEMAREALARGADTVTTNRAKRLFDELNGTCAAK